MKLSAFLDTAGKSNIFSQQEETSIFQLIQHIYPYKKLTSTSNLVPGLQQRWPQKQSCGKLVPDYPGLRNWKQ